MQNKTDHHFDAIVIGAGMSGSYAAKEFCEKGLKTLLLERGRNVEHIKDYPTTSMMPWEFPHRGAIPADAIAAAVTSRFRPLVVTTVTTVVGLYPLSVSDPFWESLGFTLMGGLLSSTLLVLLAFPVFYVALEAVRTPVINSLRRRRGRAELT